MSRTRRDIQRIKWRMLYNSWFGSERTGWFLFNLAPRDYRVLEDKIGHGEYHRGMFSKSFRVVANRKDRHRAKMALRSDDYERYLRRKTFVDDGW